MTDGSILNRGIELTSQDAAAALGAEGSIASTRLYIGIARAGIWPLQGLVGALGGAKAPLGPLPTLPLPLTMHHDDADTREMTWAITSIYEVLNAKLRCDTGPGSMGPEGHGPRHTAPFPIQ